MKNKLRKLQSLSANDTTATATLNANFEQIEKEILNTVSRDGTQPNYMDADFDLNSHKIINIGEPTEDGDVVTKRYVDENIGNAYGYSLDAAQSASNAAASAQQAGVSAANALSDANYCYSVANNILNDENIQGLAADLASEDSVVKAVEAIKDDITTVAGVAQDVSAVSDIASDVSAVADNLTNIDTVAENITDVASVANISNDVSTVADNISSVNTVASNDANINTVAGIASDVSAVASIASDVSAVEDNSTNINAVAGITTDVTTVAGIASNVSTVAGMSSNISSVVSNATNINTVASNISDISNVASISAAVTAVNNNASNINAVAGNSSNINTVASNTSAISAVANNASNINAVNANKTNIDTVAGMSSDITSVLSIASDIEDVNDNATNINTVASDISSVNAVADDISNVSAVAADLTNINAVAADLENIDNASTYADNAEIWAEGTDEEVQALGGVHSSKGWANQSAQGQVQADWNETNTASKAYIQNKPVVPDVLSSVNAGNCIEIRSLPSQYVEIESISMNNNCYYEATGFKLRGSDTVRISFEYDGTNCNVFGCFTSSSSNDNYCLYVRTQANTNFLRYGGGAYDSRLDANTKYNIVITPTGTSGMRTDSTWTEQTFESASSFCIGTTSSSATSSSLVGTIYGRIIVDGRAEFVPCKRLSDNVVGYYNLDSNVFYEPTGTPTAGAEKTAPQPVIAFVNDAGYITGITSGDVTTALGFTPADSSSLATVATTGSYTDLLNKPTIPTVNNATLTIQKNGTNVATFTANASSNVTANITVPTNTNELTNGAGFITGITSSDVTTALGYTPANDNNVVKTSGNQTINGIKTFNTPPRFKDSLTNSLTATEDIETKIVDVSRNSGGDVDGMDISRFVKYNADGENKRYVAYRAGFRNADDSANLWPALSLGVDTDGLTYGQFEANKALAPTPATSDNSTKIATTAYVKAQNYLPSSSVYYSGSTLYIG